MTNEEKGLLAKLASGVLDGMVGDLFEAKGGSTSWTEIVKGVPTRFKQGPGGKFFDGKENERYEGKLHKSKSWSTDEQSWTFFKNSAG